MTIHAVQGTNHQERGGGGGGKRYSRNVRVKLFAQLGGGGGLEIQVHIHLQFKTMHQ